ncbi:MAG: hypothetical protein DI560_27030 [Pseudomonas putida]|nr:MAG: hypothetical protein DI560_27030 [Pseudomonas putida]
MPFFAGHPGRALVCYAAHSAPPGVSRASLQALDGHTVKAVAAYHKLVGNVPEKPATSRLFYCPKKSSKILQP